MFDLQFRAKIGGPDGTDLTLIATDFILSEMLFDLSGTPSTDLTNLVAATYLNPFVFTQQTVNADLTENDYTGYALGPALIWSVPGLDTDGNHVLVADLATPFICTGDPLGEMVAGVMLRTGDDVCFGASIEPPIELVEGLIIPMTFIFQLGNRG